jgi:hypothetical protein
VTHGKDGQFRVGRAAEVVIDRRFGRRPIHLHPIPGFTEEIGVGKSRLHQDAATKDVLGHGPAAPANLRRRQIVQRDSNGITQPARKPGRVVRVSLGQMHARHRSRGMRVRRRNADAFRRQLCRLANKLLGPVADASRQQAVVDDDEGEARGSVVQHQCPGVERVVDMGGDDRMRAAIDLDAEGRGDIDSSGAGAKGTCRGGKLQSPRSKHQKSSKGQGNSLGPGKPFARPLASHRMRGERGGVRGGRAHVVVPAEQPPRSGARR